MAGDAGREVNLRMVIKKIAKAALIVFSVLFLAAGFFASRIYSYRDDGSDAPADAAIVLGAAVWGAEVSPVFRERINHGIDLYRKGKVRRLIFTGGRGNRGEPTESSAARRYALQRGIPARDIMIEEKSHTTYENILYAKELAEAQGARKVLIVSDPLHMKRAVVMARDLGLEADPSPTPSTMYRGLRSQASQLVYETYFYMGYLLGRPFLNKAN
jgi:uncharacterized SAM-binding protein YcdF (DUF218 family)